MPDLFRYPTRIKINGMRDREPCVYMLASDRFGTLYVGVTSNLVGRIIQHRAGAFDGFTKRYGIKKLVWFEIADTMDSAIAHEKKLKRWRRDTNPRWNDLAETLGLEPLA